MALVRPFRAVRPLPELAGEVASLPYDVMDRGEAAALAQDRPFSFLHVTRAEIDLPDQLDAYDDRVYEKGCERLREMIREGVLVQDPCPQFYIYRQLMKGRVQTGLVATVSVDDYLANRIKKHELTLQAKEADRLRHFDACDAQTEPVFLTYRGRQDITHQIRQFIRFNDPVYDFRTGDGVSHVLWVVDDPEAITELERLFVQVPALYIADGHHRSATAASLALKRRLENPQAPAQAEFNYFLAVLVPDHALFIMDYNRLVRDLRGMTAEEFLDKVGQIYRIDQVEGQFRPCGKAEICMYLEGTWYRLTAPPSLYEGLDPLASLDVSLLQDNILAPLLGIEDPRSSSRLDFVGGIRGQAELKRRVDEDGWAVAFALSPTPVEEMLEIADAGLIMPPKSTWFEPKLRSGLFVHLLSD